MIVADSVPRGSLLNAHDRPGHYVDCFRVDWPQPVAHEAWLSAFFHSRVFCLERWLLARLPQTVTSDAAVAALVEGEQSSFGVWTVEARTASELLLMDRSRLTRSWWASSPQGGGTTLRFGSALVAPPGRQLGALRWTIPAHRVYSRWLVSSASAALHRSA